MCALWILKCDYIVIASMDLYVDDDDKAMMMMMMMSMMMAAAALLLLIPKSSDYLRTIPKLNHS